MSEPTPGVCRYCKCRQGHPCQIYSGGEYEDCGWLFGTDRTVCTSPHCISNRSRDLRAASARIKERNRKRAPWEIEEKIQAERKQRKKESRLRCKARKAAKAERRVAI